MSIHSLELHQRRPHGRADESMVFKDDEWFITKFIVNRIEHYRLQRRTNQLDVSSVYTYETDCSKATLIGFCVMSVDNKTPFSPVVEEIRHLQKLLEIMRGQDDVETE